MKISKVSQQVKNTDRVNIFIDGKYSFSLDLGQLLDSKIKVGQEVTEAELKAFKKMSSDGKLKMRVYEWLMLRPRSAKELRDYLYKKKLEPDAIGAWVLEFQKKNLQNDESFTRWWVEQRRNKQRSSTHIKFELKTKGVGDEIIKNALDNNLSDDKTVLKELIAKKRRHLKYQDDKKLAEYLMRLGYRYSLIKELLSPGSE